MECFLITYLFILLIRYGTLDRYRGHEGKYGVDIALRLTPIREKEVLAVLMDMLKKGMNLFTFCSLQSVFVRHLNASLMSLTYQA